MGKHNLGFRCAAPQAIQISPRWGFSSKSVLHAAKVEIFQIDYPKFLFSRNLGVSYGACAWLNLSHFSHTYWRGTAFSQFKLPISRLSIR